MKRSPTAASTCAGAILLMALAHGLFWPVVAVAKPPASNLETFDAAWRLIDETYFDPTFHGVDWKAIRTELRPKAEAARDVQELRDVIEEMLRRLGDSHMALIPGTLAESVERAERGRLLEESQTSGAPPQRHARERANSDGNAGFDVRLSGNKALVVRVDATGPAAREGVRPGWILKAIEKEPIAELLRPVTAHRDFRRAQFFGWRLLSSAMSGPSGAAGEFQFLDGQDLTVTRTVRWRPEQGEPTKLGNLPTLYSQFESRSLALENAGTAGYIRFNLWMVPIIRALDEKMDALRNADGIVIDLRGNLGGLGAMVMGVAGHFLNDRVALGTLKMRGSDLKFYANPRLVNAQGERVESYAGPVAILIDSLTLSAAEIFAGGMQAIGRARIFGEHSGGQALPAIWDRLPNGDVLYHAFGDFVTARGTRLEGEGVSPDELVPITREDLLAGRDAPLLAAQRWIEKQKRIAKYRN